MKWIKANERLPDVGKLVYIRAQKTYMLIGIRSIQDNKLHKASNYKDPLYWDYSEIEWLDESIPPQPEKGEAKRPALTDYLIVDKFDLKDVMKIYADQPELFNYAKALDFYIDHLEATPPAPLSPEGEKTMEEILLKHLPRIPSGVDACLKKAMQEYASLVEEENKRLREEIKYILKAVADGSDLYDKIKEWT
jgi:hypothetical protein